MALVRKRMDPKHPSSPTDEEMRRYDALRDEDIDYSDSPDLTQAGLSEVELDERHRIISVRVPVGEDVVEWFRRHAPQGAAQGMASVLADYVRAQQRRMS